MDLSLPSSPAPSMRARSSARGCVPTPRYALSAAARYRAVPSAPIAPALGPWSSRSPFRPRLSCTLPARNCASVLFVPDVCARRCAASRFASSTSRAEATSFLLAATSARLLPLRERRQALALALRVDQGDEVVRDVR